MTTKVLIARINHFLCFIVLLSSLLPCAGRSRRHPVLARFMLPRPRPVDPRPARAIPKRVVRVNVPPMAVPQEQAAHLLPQGRLGQDDGVIAGRGSGPGQTNRQAHAVRWRDEGS